MSHIYPDQVLNIELDCEADITESVAPQIAVRKPDGSEVVWDAQVVETTVLRYTTQSGDLDQVGIYRLQARPNMTAGPAPGQTALLRVSAPFT